MRDSCRRKWTCGRGGRVQLPCSNWCPCQWLTSCPSDLHWCKPWWWTTWPWWIYASRAAISNPLKCGPSAWWVALLGLFCYLARWIKHFTNLQGVFNLLIQFRAFKNILEKWDFLCLTNQRIGKTDKAEFVWPNTARFLGGFDMQPPVVFQRLVQPLSFLLSSGLNLKLMPL